MDPSNSEQVEHDITHRFKELNGEKQGEFLQEMHEQMKKDEEINIPNAISKYNKEFPGEGVLRLLQDLQRMRFVYNNLTEEVKRIDEKKFREVVCQDGIKTISIEDAAGAIRKKYVDMGMVPEDYLPNTHPRELLKICYRSAKKLWNAEIFLLSSYNREVMNAMRLEKGTTVTFQIGLQVDGPGVTVGWERTIE